MATNPSISVCAHLEDDARIEVQTATDDPAQVWLTLTGDSYPTVSVFLSQSKVRDLAGALNAYCDTRPVTVAA